MPKCHTHDVETSAGTCRSCLREFCRDCLVYSYGRAKAPYCIRCALVAAGTSVPDGSDGTTESVGSLYA
jgi:hypothetical protein